MNLIVVLILFFSTFFPVLSFAETDAEFCVRKYAAQEYKGLYSKCLDAAMLGDMDSQYIVGRIEAASENEIEAEKWFKKAADQGHLMAEVMSNGGYKGDHFKKIIMISMRKAAEKGEAKDEYAYGLSLARGEYTSDAKPDYQEAIFWIVKAAAKMYAPAFIKLAELYDKGLGVDKDEKAAFSYYLLASGNNVFAQAEVGRRYLLGKGVEKDEREGAKFTRKAAEQSFDAAQFTLGVLYFSGLGVPKNKSEAVNWYRKAAEQGYGLSQHQLGLLYFQGDGVQKDVVQSLAWFTVAASSEDKLDNTTQLRDALEKTLTPDEVLQAQKLALKLQKDIEQNKIRIAAMQKKDAQDRNVTPLATPKITKPAFTANDIALVIGIEKYRTVPTTEYAAADASMMRDYLKALGIPERNIEFLADDRATLSDIRKVIETKLPNMVKANSRVIVYYAGHGAPGMARGESYLVPYDGDPSFLADTAYPLSRLYDRLSRLKAKEVLVILDSCFSGSGGRSVIAKNARPLVMVKDTPPPSNNKMIVLTSSRGSQITTSLPEVGHGAFTYFFLRALQEGNRDIGEVYAYLKDRVTEEAKRQNVDQTPSISPEPAKLKGRFVFAR